MMGGLGVIISELQINELNVVQINELNCMISCQFFFLFQITERFVYGYDVIRVNIGRVFVNICHQVVRRLIIIR